MGYKKFLVVRLGREEGYFHEAKLPIISRKEITEAIEDFAPCTI